MLLSLRFSRNAGQILISFNLKIQESKMTSYDKEYEVPDYEYVLDENDEE